MVKLSTSQRNNLTKLADYLETLPYDYKHFRMSQFMSVDSYSISEKRARELEADYARNNGGLSKHECGSVACAIGHGPAAGILFKETEFESNTVYDSLKKRDVPIMIPNWEAYSSRFVKRDIPTWEWLFGADWDGVDDHHWGAAARIRFILAGNKLPEEYKENRTIAAMSHKKYYKKYRKTNVKSKVAAEVG